ncbi:molybdopterin-containing oxidoreductase family protein [Thermoflavimicrobium dichotomicum]|uniref:Anaerobic selenocysteine-containing dehydrogenase n=1 Tax=Thermoflavimicrobium dichotomicum TaxID=46223 RepID=A0A1I3TBP1_9BACL|nr:molybdopterin oxidoreductase family protein [Thermoflavimicrobium dichotomicum]SFJ66917.1 Anaerobic selenocysteine-containing dehydrogenase [Thermoflavimicrobium dichotomicum]
MQPDLKQFRSVCPLDCPDTCSLSVTVKNNRIVSVTGNPHHPVTRGVICHKVRKFPERIYHPDRVLYPLKRTEKKGDLSSFQRITWEEAYEEIVSKFQSIIATYGAEAILPYSFYGNMGILNSECMDRRFFHRLGASHLDRTICNSASSEGIRYTMGMGVGIDPEDTVHAKLIIIWGCNLISTNMHQAVYVNEARKKGAKVIVIDVHRNRTAKWADWFIQLRPGTDTAFALGLIHVLIAENYIDKDFISRYTKGYSELQQAVKPYTPESVSNITGVPAEDIIHLARMYGQTSPSFIRVGNGLQHHDNGGMAVRTIFCLPALTGQWGKKGGGALKGNSGYFGFNRERIQRPDLHPNPHARTINMNQLGDALLSAEPPIYALFVYNCNPAQVAPDQSKVRQGLMRDDLFTVVHDLFLTDTCRYADLVLPATSHFENLDLYRSYWHLYLQLHEPVIEPIGECKSNFTLFKELAHRMGFKEDAFQVTEEEMIQEILETTDSLYLKGITYEKLKKQGFVKLTVPDELTFPAYIPTPSGKIEFYSEQLEQKGLPPVPAYIPIQDNDNYPLIFVPGPNHQYLNSTLANIASLQKMEGKPFLHIHPEDAKQRSIQTGDEILIYNERGRCKLYANVTEDVLPGTVVSQGLWWDDPEQGLQSVNHLTSQRLADMGGGATFFSTTVEVCKFSSIPSNKDTGE